MFICLRSAFEHIRFEPENIRLFSGDGEVQLKVFDIHIGAIVEIHRLGSVEHVYHGADITQVHPLQIGFRLLAAADELLTYHLRVVGGMIHVNTVIKREFPHSLGELMAEGVVIGVAPAA